MQSRILLASATVLALGLAAHTPSALAGDGAWTDITPHAEVDGVVGSRAAQGVLYTFSATQGIHLSEDNGETWASRNGGLTLTEITAVATAPHDSNRVVAAERGGQLVVSNNRGGSWSAGPSAAINHVTAIVFDPTNDDIIYALDDGISRVHKSIDGGTTWTQLGSGLPASVGSGDETSMVIVPLLPDTLYMGTGDGVYKSEDAAATWAKVQGLDLPNGPVLQLIPHPTEPETVAGLFVIGAEIQFWRTNNAGGQWYRPGPDATAEYRAQAVAVDMHDPSRLLLGSGNGIFGSVDAGHNWVELNTDLQPDVPAETRTVQAVAFDPVVTRRYYAVSGGVLQIYDGLIATDLVVSATPTPGQVDAGGTTTIEFAVANITGEPATNVVFKFTAPAAFAIQSWDSTGGSCAQNGASIECTLATIDPGIAITGSVVAAATGGDGVHNFDLSAIATEREATPENNTLALGVRIGDAPAPPPPPPGPSPTPTPTPTPTPPVVPDAPRAPSGGGSSGGGGNGGWLWLLGAGAALVMRRGSGVIKQ